MFFISDSLVENERNFSMVRAEQFHSDIEQINRKIMNLRANFSGMLGAYLTRNKLFCLNLIVCLFNSIIAGKKIDFLPSARFMLISAEISKHR